MITVAKNIALTLGLLAASPLWAATYDYQAVTDFTDINAGEVPYYRHNGVNALAINAAIEDYRNKFGRATLVFAHEAGQYDVTITSLGETDGDGTFQFVVNGEVVGSSVNEPATTDYGLQYHTFTDISIPAGALIGVESSAVSNGLIPEGDAFAFARGRWTVLSLTTVEDTAPPPEPIPEPIPEVVDLGISMSVNNQSPSEGDEVTFSVAVENYSDEFTATNPVVTISLPNSASNIVSDSCTNADANTLTCSLAELSPSEKANFNITAMLNTAGSQSTTAQVQADQDDPNASNNSDTDNITINSPVVIPVDNTIDLSVAVSSVSNNVEPGDSVIFDINVSNLHDNNTAVMPAVALTFSESLQFESSDRCSLSNDLIVCYTEELPAGNDTTFSVTATAKSTDSAAQILATISATQPDANTTNNEAQFTTEIKPVAAATLPTETPQEQPQTTEQTESTTESNSDNPFTTTPENTASNKSGGGAWDMLMLLSLVILAFTRLPITATSRLQRIPRSR